jgi:hypothetical protein
VFVQHSERSFHTSDVTSKNNQWEMYSETVPKYRDTKVRTKEPLEQYNQTKDDTDYLWYTTRYHSYLSHLTVSAPCHSLFFLDHKIHLTIFLFVTIFSFRLESDDLPFRNDIRPVLQVKSSAHAMMGFANDAFVGNLDQLCNNLVPPKTLACCMNASKAIVQIKIPLHVGCARGNKQVKGFMFEKPVDLKVGVNHVVLLSSTMGMKVKICRNCGMCLECKKTDNTVLSDSQVKKLWSY